MLWESGQRAQLGFGENTLKKSLVVAAAIAAVTPLFVSAGAAQAATTFTPELVYAFDTSGDRSFEPNYISSFGSKVAIELDNGDMWVSDGTPAGTVDMSAALAAAGVTDVKIERNRWDTNSLDIGGTLYFFARTINDWDIFKTDGVSVTSVTNGLGDNDTMYYLGGFIYTVDGSVSQVNPATGAIVEVDTNIDCDLDGATQVQLVGGKIVYGSDENTCSDDRLFTWDPASPLTAPVELTASAGGLGRDASDLDYMDDTEDTFFMFEGEMYFNAEANDGSNALGSELFKTDGTQAGTVLVKDINTSGDDSSNAPDDDYVAPFIFNGEMYFGAEVGGEGELWKTDGTTAGTVLAIADPFDAGDLIESAPVEFNGKLFLDFNTVAEGGEYYMSDGTEAGTTLLLDINVGNDYSPCYSNCVTPVLFAGQIFFVAYDGSSNQVWTTDGTTAGTVAVTTFEDEYPVGDQSEASLVVAGDNLFFGVTDESLGEMALYKIAGSSSSPQLANTGADLRGIALGALGAMALVALGGALVIARRRNAQV